MTNELLTVEGLNKSYGKHKALKNVSFSVRSGEIIGLLGHNGAGKSTLIKCLMGSVQSYSGKIRVYGVNIRSDHHVIRDHVGFLLEPAFCDYLSARANLELLNVMSSEPNKQRVEAVLDMVALKKFAKKKVGEFSFGMRQRLGLAQVLLTQPQLIILDEPTVGLDPLGVEIIKKIIIDCSSKGIAVLFSSHQIHDVLDICHRTIIMKDGSIVHDGSTAELNKKNYVLHLGESAEEHRDALQQLDPALTVTENVIRFTNAEALNAVLGYLQQNALPVVDMECATNMSELMKLIQP